MTRTPREPDDPTQASALVHHQLRALAAYQQAWIHTTVEEIEAQLSACWTPISSYTNPIVAPVTGVQAMTDLILDYTVMFPDAALRPITDVAIHHGHAYYRWSVTSSASIRLLGHDYGRMLTGHDQLTFDEDGKIAVVVAFFDQPVILDRPGRPPRASRPLPDDHRAVPSPTPDEPPPAPPATTIGMADLFAYLSSKVDEDEAALHDLFTLTPWRTWTKPPSDPVHEQRLLADVTARRRVLTLHRPLWPDDDEPRCRACADPILRDVRATWPCPTLLAIAQRYDG